MESIAWAAKFPADVSIYVFSVLGFMLFPARLGRQVWALVAWFLLLNVVFLLGLPYAPDWRRPIFFVVLGQLPWLLFMADLLFRGRIARILADISLRDLVLWQAVRFMGLHFVLAIYGRHVPEEFALQVGFSEMLTAVGALALWAVYRPERGWYRTLIVFWNAYGLTSVLVADWRIFFSNPYFSFARYSREIFQYMTAYPQAWMYTFWFPAAVAMHAAVFYKLYLGRASGR